MGDDEDSRRNWTLTASWLVQALRPDPQHPILALKGGEGTAKSFTAYLLRFLVDPNEARDDYIPPDLRTLCIYTDHQWVLALDNISSMPEWLSNALCKLVTGMGFRVRSLYSDRSLEIFKARRPITINGITDLGTNRDLLSRTLLVNLPVITKYRLESELEGEYEEKRSGILGALLDAVSAGIQKLPSLEVEGRGSRMADFDLWGRATEEALGFEEGDFLKAREGTEREAMQTALEAEPIATTIERFAASFTEAHPWEGPAEELLSALNNAESDEVKKREKSWPKSPDALGNKLSKLSSSLMIEGVYAEKTRFTSGERRGKRGWRLHYSDPAPGGGSGGDTSENASVPKGVPTENPKDKPKSRHGDTVDTGDTSQPGAGDDEGEV
jgi:hypothetical protein